MFDWNYFNGGQKVGGYAHEGYWDYPIHWATFQRIMSLKPKSVLEIGCARGYLVKRLQDVGIPASGLEISEHCHLTRACEGIAQFDVCQTPWPIEDSSFDLCFSIATLEHIPERYLSAVISEIERVSRRGLHGVDLGLNDDGFDQTHVSLHSVDWWEGRFSDSQTIIDKESLESGRIVLPPDDGKLKINIGSFTTMFHHGWLNTDIIPLYGFANQFGYKFQQLDATRPLPFKNRSVDLIYSSHVLEHLPRPKDFLIECRRVLKPDGTIRIAVPDAEKLIQYYQAGNLQKFDELNPECKGQPTQAGKLWSLLVGKEHRACYDWPTLQSLAESVGLHIERRAFRQGNPQILAETIDLFPDLSLYAELTHA